MFDVDPCMENLEHILHLARALEYKNPFLWIPSADDHHAMQEIA